MPQMPHLVFDSSCRCAKNNMIENKLALLVIPLLPGCSAQSLPGFFGGRLGRDLPTVPPSSV